MKRKRRFFSASNLMVLCALLCVALALLLALQNPSRLYLGIAGGVLLVVGLFSLLAARGVRRGVARILGAGAVAEAAAASGVAALSLPAAVLNEQDQLVWYNAAFRQAFVGGGEVPLVPIAKVADGLALKRGLAVTGQNLKVGDKEYTAYGATLAGEEGGLYLVLFSEDTLLKTRSAEYLATRPSVLYFLLDTYDDIIKDMRESERARIMSEVDLALEEYVGHYGGLLRKVSSSRWVAVLEERYMSTLVANRFNILDTVREIGGESGNVSLSVGVGRLGATLKECDDKARQAIDMCLGRGGDQAAVNGPDGFEFYGGLSRSVERRTKVKSRVIASAIRELMGEYQRVFIMGHKNSDMDSVGAAVGMLRFARICGKPASIVIDEKGSLSDSLLRLLRDNGYGDTLLHPERAAELADEDTLLVVVDTHLQYLIESKAVYEACGATVVIDHHRKQVGHIDDALIFYHEPSASSASELVSELLEYLGDHGDDKMTPVEAEALLSGIMLDTRTFSLHVGVRTFEASAYLRRMGAETAKVKRLFTSSMDEYLYRSHLVSEAKVMQGCAIVVSDRVPPECEVVAPQAANDLLTITGVKASFVAIKQGGEVRISARSMGAVNVQLILEKLGGGGHLTMAGAQLKDVTTAEAEKRLMKAIEEYWEDNPKGALG